MKNNYDIIILGAGPAGSNFARRIDSKKYNVLLVNGAKQKGAKPCGGLISPDAQGLLAEYNINLPKDVLVNPQLFSVKTIDLESEQVTYYRRSYMNVDRIKFELIARLISAFFLRLSFCKTNFYFTCFHIYSDLILT